MHEQMLICIESRRLVLLTGDITDQDTDIIVNAAQSSLLGGYGIDGAIHRVGGPAILEDCVRVLDRQGPLPAGRAVSTTAGNLKAKYLVHTVGPIWNGGSFGEEVILANCYRNSLLLAEMLHASSVAFPSISTGAHGYPVDAAARAALRTISKVLPTTNAVHEVRMVLFDDFTFAEYCRAAELIGLGSAGCSRRE